VLLVLVLVLLLLFIVIDDDDGVSVDDELLSILLVSVNSHPSICIGDATFDVVNGITSLIVDDVTPVLDSYSSQPATRSPYDVVCHAGMTDMCCVMRITN
jgi:hypothetical protein